MLNNYFYKELNKEMAWKKLQYTILRRDYKSGVGIRFIKDPIGVKCHLDGKTFHICEGEGCFYCKTLKCPKLSYRYISICAILDNTPGIQIAFLDKQSINAIAKLMNFPKTFEGLNFFITPGINYKINKKHSDYYTWEVEQLTDNEIIGRYNKNFNINSLKDFKELLFNNTNDRLIDSETNKIKSINQLISNLESTTYKNYVGDDEQSEMIGNEIPRESQETSQEVNEIPRESQETSQEVNEIPRESQENPLTIPRESQEIPPKTIKTIQTTQTDKNIEKGESLEADASGTPPTDNYNSILEEQESEMELSLVGKENVRCEAPPPQAPAPPPHLKGKKINKEAYVRLAGTFTSDDEEWS